jgi:hypothetical protein
MCASLFGIGRIATDYAMSYFFYGEIGQLVRVVEPVRSQIESRAVATYLRGLAVRGRLHLWRFQQLSLRRGFVGRNGWLPLVVNRDVRQHA